jgi:hypothetical protein
LPNADKHKNHEAIRSMNSKYLAVVAVLAVMLVTATALATEDAFADKKRHDDKKKGGYGKSQAVSQVNDCGNGELPLNVWCQNTASQIQGEGNYVATESAQGSIEEESNGPGMQDNAVASTDQQTSVEEE